MQKSEKDAPIPKISANVPKKKQGLKIGMPGYKVTKQKDPESGQKSLLFEVEYPDINTKVQPRYRIMSSFEQKILVPDDQY